MYNFCENNYTIRAIAGMVQEHYRGKYHKSVNLAMVAVKKEESYMMDFSKFGFETMFTLASELEDLFLKVRSIMQKGDTDNFIYFPEDRMQQLRYWKDYLSKIGGEL